MGSTYASLIYHFVWGTKDRCSTIAPNWEERLHAWLGGALRHAGGVAEIINGMPDHVHVLASLRPKHAAAEIARDLKSGSSLWIHTEIGRRNFGWQDGYFVATVSPRAIGPVQRYIQNQKEHHAKLSWIDELKSLLAEAGIDYDPQYLV